MPQYARDPNALNVLAALRSPRNLTPTGNSYLDKRRTQIASGDDDLAPSELEQRQAQMTEGVGQFTSPSGNVQTSLSRDQIRDSGIHALKRKLLLDDEAEKSALAAKLAIGAQTGDYGLKGKEIEGQYNVKAAEGSARAGMDRLLAAQAAQDSRQADAIASREKIAQGSQTAQNERSANQVPFQVSRDVATARQNYNSSFSKWGRNIFGTNGGADQYEAALTAQLRRSGSLDMITQAAQQTIAEKKTADQALAEAQAAGVVLDPDEQDALRLFVQKLGGR